MDPRLKAIADSAEAREWERLSGVLRQIGDRGHPGSLVDGLRKRGGVCPECQRITAQAAEDF